MAAQTLVELRDAKTGARVAGTAAIWNLDECVETVRLRADAAVPILGPLTGFVRLSADGYETVDRPAYDARRVAEAISRLAGDRPALDCLIDWDLHARLRQLLGESQWV